MAFSEAERVKIRFYLGWSARFHQSDSRLEQALNAVDNLPDTEALIRDDLLVSLDAVRTSLTDSHKRLKALKVGSINLPVANEVMQLRNEGRRHAGSLASLLGVAVRHDVFGSGRYRQFASATGLTGGLDNYYPHG